MSTNTAVKPTRAIAIAALALSVACAMCAFAQEKAWADDSGSQVKAAYSVTTLPTYGNDAVNTTGKASTRPVYCYGPVEGVVYSGTSATVTNLDVTNDGWADKIKVTATKVPSYKSGRLRQVKVTVNGKKVVNYSNYSYGISRVAVSVKTLANKKEFIWVDITDGNGKAVVQKLYRYSGKKFVTVFSNKAFKKAKTSNPYILGVSTSGNSLKVTANLTNTVTGNTRVHYTYVYAGDGTMMRASNTTTNFSYAASKSGTYSKSKLTAAGKFKVYKNVKLKKVAFTVTPGKTVQPVAVRIKGGKLLYKLRMGSKTGWISCPSIKRKSSKSPTTLFYETYGKAALKSSVPSYTTTKYYTATELQRYNDHALFMARNEIYARNGYVFKIPELDRYFRHCSWWSYRRTPLNSVEQANATLMYNIEKGRQSPYLT